MARPVSALESATDLTAVIVYDRARGARQTRTLLIMTIVMGLLAVAGIVTAIVAGNAGVLWFAGFFGIIALIGGAVTAAMRLQIGQRIVGFSPRGVFVPALTFPVPWEQISMLSAVRFSNRAGGRGAGAVATAAMSRGGVNDGGRVLNVIVRDAAALRQQVGTTFDYLVVDDLGWEEKGANGFAVLLSNPSDEPTFATFLLALKAEADARGIPITVANR
jgi:hypothetical protein